MTLNVQIQSKNKITNLAHQIIKDWFQKIQEQVQQSLSKSKLSSYSVFLTNKQPKLNSQLKQKFNLIIILQNSQINPAHMLSLSGQLSTFGQNQKQFIPTHVAQISIANSIAIVVMQYYFQIVRNNVNLQKNKNSTVINDTKNININKTFIHRLNCIDCLKYYGAFNVSAKYNGFMTNKRGNNILDGGAPFYAIYPTKQGLLAVGNLQPKFYEQMIDQLQLTAQDKEFCLENQLNIQIWPKMRKIFAQKFVEKTAQQWQQIMNKRDTCVTAVRDVEKIHESFLHPFLVKPKI